MKIEYILLVIVLIAGVISCRVTANSEEGVADKKNRALSFDGSEDRVNATGVFTKKGNDFKLDSNDLREQLDAQEKENEVKKGNDGEQRETEGSSSESEKGRSPPVREKCDDSSYRCTNKEKTLVACLKVPGNESPALSLLILNKGKGTQSIRILAPDSVQLEKKQIELQQNKDTEVKVSIRDVENRHFIVLTAGNGHGNCSLDFKDFKGEVAGMKIDDDSSDRNSRRFSIYNSRGFVFLGGIVIAGVLVLLLCTKSGRKYFTRKGLRYQRLDMELPVSSGWDNSWADSWDDEEASIASSLPLTPTTLSSRKFKEGWKD